MSPFKTVRKKISHYLKHMLYSISDLCLRRSVPIAPNTLVIVKNDHIGDYILFRNFLPYLKESEVYKHYKVVLIGNVVWKELAETMDGEFYDQMIWVDFKKLAHDFTYRAKMMKELSSTGYETLFYPVYSGDRFTEEFLISRLKAKRKIKFNTDSGAPKKIFDERLPSTEGGMFELHRYKEMFENFLAVSIPKIRGRAIYLEQEHTKNLLPGRNYVVLFPSASAHLKRWSTEYFAQVANHILEHSSYRIVIAGSAKDHKYAKSIMKMIPREHAFRLFDLTGQTSLQELAQLVNESDLLITNDSVPIHMAALYNKKAICVLMGENYGRFAPYPQALYPNGVFVFTPEVRQLIEETQVQFLELTYNPNINTISSDMVTEEVDRILDLCVRI